ncbi:xylulokinase [Lichenicoccus roseus]|uniref:xylulokinase n=1 Tax=Lichenicoccus roseus TaxID=2683649 RepID=UPI001F0EBDB5|nr:xylulokinase [Lichenicoccus roseus]
MTTAGAVFLGIDLGTSAVKALLADMDQAVVATASVPLATSRPRPDWSEQSPQDWWAAVGEVVARLRRAAPDAMAQVQGVGLSGQMHGLVLLDAEGAVLRPAILWNDSRAADEAAQLASDHPDLADLAGVAHSTSFWPAKLLWLAHHQPEILGRTRHMMLPKDYLRWRMTGRYQTDGCDAGGTALLDVSRRDWSAPIIEVCNVDRAVLPEIVEGSQAASLLAPEIAAAWGISTARVVVAGGGGDSATGAIGIGAIADGDAYISLGTSAQLFVTTDRYRPAVEAGVQSFAHALPDRWFQAGAVLNGASALAWATRLFGEADPAALLAEAEARPAGPGRLLFLPYLTGERCPHNDPYARGVLFGLTPASSRAEIVQAVLEGVACSLADALACLARAGTVIEEAAIVGGGARSLFWTRIIADVVGLPIVRYAGSETGPAFGAARLARLAVTGEPTEQVCGKPPVLDRTLPDPARHAAYGVALSRFRSLYGALRSEFRN